MGSAPETDAAMSCCRPVPAPLAAQYVRLAAVQHVVVPARA